MQQQTRFYSQDGYSLEDKPSVQMRSWFITGLSDGESCFYAIAVSLKIVSQNTVDQ